MESKKESEKSSFHIFLKIRFGEGGERERDRKWEEFKWKEWVMEKDRSWMMKEAILG